MIRELYILAYFKNKLHIGQPGDFHQNHYRRNVFLVYSKLIGGETFFGPSTLEDNTPTILYNYGRIYLENL